MIWTVDSVAYWDYNIRMYQHRALVNIINTTKYYMCSVLTKIVFKRNANIFALYPPVFIKYILYTFVRACKCNIIYHYNTSGDPFHFLASIYIYYMYTHLFILIIEPRRYAQ